MELIPERKSEDEFNRCFDKLALAFIALAEQIIEEEEKNRPTKKSKKRSGKTSCG